MLAFAFGPNKILPTPYEVLHPMMLRSVVMLMLVDGDGCVLKTYIISFGQ